MKKKKIKKAWIIPVRGKSAYSSYRKIAPVFELLDNEGLWKGIEEIYVEIRFPETAKEGLKNLYNL